MILWLICQLMCATIPGAHIRCMHSILSFNWSATYIYILLLAIPERYLCVVFLP
jgi:hypothetical protein